MEIEFIAFALNYSKTREISPRVESNFNVWGILQQFYFLWFNKFSLEKIKTLILLQDNFYFFSCFCLVQFALPYCKS